MLEIRNLCKAYGKKQVLNNLNLTIEPGQVYGLLGANGAGKTTTIKTLTRLIGVETKKKKQDQLAAAMLNKNGYGHGSQSINHNHSIQPKLK
ncbi:MAG: ATP-binding cassette domain-containing protein, partial [Cyanobacteria bacterium J083]